MINPDKESNIVPQKIVDLENPVHVYLLKAPNSEIIRNLKRRAAPLLLGVSALGSMLGFYSTAAASDETLSDALNPNISYAQTNPQIDEQQGDIEPDLVPAWDNTATPVKTPPPHKTPSHTPEATDTPTKHNTVTPGPTGTVKPPTSTATKVVPPTPTNTPKKESSPTGTKIVSPSATVTSESHSSPTDTSVPPKTEVVSSPTNTPEIKPPADTATATHGSSQPPSNGPENTDTPASTNVPIENSPTSTATRILVMPKALPSTGNPGGNESLPYIIVGGIAIAATGLALKRYSTN